MIEKTGDLFTAETDAIGHGVNCRGLMGAGIAVGFRNRYPGMYAEYRKLCVEGLLLPGQIYPYNTTPQGRAVINIASQEYPGPDAKLEWLEQGLAAAMQYCTERGLTSLAIPRIGCGIGGLQWEDARLVMEQAAEHYDAVALEVWSL